MPTEFYEDSLDLTVQRVAAVPFDLAFEEPYPWMRLQLQSDVYSKTFESLVLENELIRITLLPELGMRIWSIYDLKNRVEFLSAPSQPKVVDIGPRGAGILDGLLVGIGDQHRSTSLSRADWQAFPAAGADGAAAIVFGETGSGVEADWLGCVTLFPGRRSFTFEFKVHNRSLQSIRLPSGFSVFLPGYEEVSRHVLKTADGRVMHIEPSGFMGNVELHYDSAVFNLLPEHQPILTPRQIVSSRTEFSVYSGVPGDVSVTSDACIGVDDTSVQFQSSRLIPNCSLVVESDGEKLAAVIDLDPAVPILSLKEAFGGHPDSVLITDKDHELVAWPTETENFGQDTLNLPHLGAIETLELPEELPELQRLFQVPGIGHAALVRAAQIECQNSRFQAADTLIDQAINLNAEDHLLWWMKAAIHRRIKASDESDVRLNAHFLAPLEPLLRIESFLSQGQEQGKAANPIMAPLAKNLDASLDGIHHMLEAGFTEDVVRVLDELLRHTDSPMLRVLSAWLLETRSRMSVEAGIHIQALENISLTPPYPWRKFERDAVNHLAVTHPDSKALQSLSRLINAY